MYKTLAIFDKDAEYLRHLADYLKTKAPGLFQVKLFTKEEALKEFLKEEGVDILLLAEETPEADSMAAYCIHLILLVQTPEQEKKLSPNAIYKYQPGEAILKELRKRLPEDALRNTGQQSFQKEIISILSLNPGKVSQGFSLALWDEKCRENRTLFTTLLAYPLLKELRIQEGETGLSELIYYLKQNSSGLPQKLKEYVQRREGFEYIKGVSFGTDLNELTAEDVSSWFSILLQWEYDTVIFEIGTLTQASLKVLAESSVIYLVSEEDRLWEEQLKSFLQQLKWAGWEDLLDKIVRVTPDREQITAFEGCLLMGLKEGE
ncbi:hypothetical protein SAMN02745136_04072 [Anaerocolumna jejuensis DSM 15929]|uniref:Uncharacterized protein n=1 Tax=Anaerocolumna jejuensis DSM 15929 TaxID=1121322 RepID=A0A1M6XUE3_9FIRM|nr:hypothetical protein [Anaerocolumna jejuensis]SHL09601.1 hypothetical protein SAMN02745136_04072 [Anaerocolumna jejuensis DSM 15929]